MLDLEEGIAGLFEEAESRGERYFRIDEEGAAGRGLRVGWLMPLEPETFDGLAAEAAELEARAAHRRAEAKAWRAEAKARRQEHQREYKRRPEVRAKDIEKKRQWKRRIDEEIRARRPPRPKGWAELEAKAKTYCYDSNVWNRKQKAAKNGKDS
jgi:hypothetical protein